LQEEEPEQPQSPFILMVVGWLVGWLVCGKGLEVSLVLEKSSVVDLLSRYLSPSTPSQSISRRHGKDRNQEVKIEAYVPRSEVVVVLSVSGGPV
jgi:hypothetical protein